MKNLLTYLLLLGFFGCTDNEQYKIQFEQVDWLKTGDRVTINGLDVGQVKNLKLDDEQKILATIEIGPNIKLTKGSTFTIHSDLLGAKHIEIDLSDSKELMNSKEIQKGTIQPLDRTEFKKLTPEQRDSLTKHDPVYRLADTVFQMLKNYKDDKDEKN
ncbi:MAG: MlaD family protein [Cyclobacteriaceae bacterium]|jgi:ABC-type transporter Mla subunit MlaD